MNKIQRNDIGSTFSRSARKSPVGVLRQGGKLYHNDLAKRAKLTQAVLDKIFDAWS